MAIEIGAVPLALACLVEIGTGYSLSGGFEAARSLYQQVLAHPAAPTAESLRAARLLAALPAEEAHIARNKLTRRHTWRMRPSKSWSPGSQLTVGAGSWPPEMPVGDTCRQGRRAVWGYYTERPRRPGTVFRTPFLYNWHLRFFESQA